MSALGVVEVIGSDTSFFSEPPRPAVPGTDRVFGEGYRQSASQLIEAEAIRSAVSARLADAATAALRRFDSRPSSSTSASLAHALEAMGSRDEAASAAKQALALAGRDSSGSLLDPLSVRIALEVLVRAGQVDAAVVHGKQLPLDSFSNLFLSASLAEAGRFEESHAFLDRVQTEDRNPVAAFLLIKEGNDRAAVPLLRSVLRKYPDDADSAHNLSIALWRVGSRRKAISAALQATRSAPAREDIFLHYLELLLAEREFSAVDREVDLVLSKGVQPTARLLIGQARAKLALRDFPKAEKLLERAEKVALSSDQPEIVHEVRSNLVRLRAAHGKIGRENAIDRLLKLHEQSPQSAVVVANLAQVANRKSHVPMLARAFDRVREYTHEARIAFLEYQIATLSGDNARAADKALAWLELEPRNQHACSAALIALGIGEERWAEAVSIAYRIVDEKTDDLVVLNNAAYVLAMSGAPEAAVEVLESIRADDFIIKATLGLAYLASNQIDKGMKLYRMAAQDAEKVSDDSRSLMTCYQALVVRQLGILNTADMEMLSALSLPAVALPEDWEDRPEFLRLYNIAQRHGYGWPLSID